MKMVLTPEQKQQLEQMHDSEGDSHVCDRIKAVLLASEGRSQYLKLFVSMNQPSLVILVIVFYLKNSDLRKLIFMRVKSLLTSRQSSVFATWLPAWNKLQHHHGFSYKKPNGAPHKLKPEEQQAFIEYYNDVLKSNDAPVLFLYAVHLIQSTKLSYGWVRKG